VTTTNEPTPIIPGRPREVLVLGGTGKTGRRVVNRLAEQGVRVRAASRNPAESVAGINPFHFDWDDASTHGPALAGVDAVYLIPPAMVVDHVAQVTAFIAAAQEAGSPRIVMLTARGVNTDDAIPMRQEELVLETSGLRWSVVRPTWFNQNFSEGFLEPAVFGNGVISVPAGDGGVPFIDADDIADVATALLLDPSLDGQAYDISGPETMSWAAAIAMLGEALDRDLTYVDADPVQWEQSMVGQGVPAAYAGLLGGLFSVIRNGYDAHRSDGVEKLLGHEPTSFRAWAETLTNA